MPVVVTYPEPIEFHRDCVVIVLIPSISDLLMKNLKVLQNLNGGLTVGNVESIYIDLLCEVSWWYDDERW